MPRNATGEVVAMENRWVESGAARLAADIVGADGARQAILLLHAGVADRRMWRDQLAALAAADAGYRGVAYDRRGFGDSLHADDRYSQVGELWNVVAATTPGAPVVLVGCSQGGRIALDAALAHPDRVRALVLVAPASSGAPENDDYPPAILAWIAKVEAAEASADIDRINALEAHAWLDGPLADEGRVGGEARALFLAMNEIALRAEVRGEAIAPPAAYDRLEDIQVPTLVIWGDLDFPDLVQRCEELARRIPGARGLMLRNAAHLPNLEQPDAFNRAMLAFLAALPR
jgi:pimeloyl-ACP methyl ester carboxylesterase